MTIRLIDQYPGGVNAPPGDDTYPDGVPRNVSAPGAGDGTPLEASWLQDLYGWIAAIMHDPANTGVQTPDGTPDNAVSSQILDALKLILLQRSELAENGGNILTANNSLARGEIHGLATTRIAGGISVNIAEGVARTPDNGSDVNHSAPIQKDISVTWAEGNLAGGLAPTLSIAVGWYQLFVVGKPDGSTDCVWDNANGAGNFFGSAAADTAGFTDSTLYRRIGWHYWTGTVIRDYRQDPNDVDRWVWAIPSIISASPSVPDGARQSYSVNTDVPRDTTGVFDFQGDTATSDSAVKVTEAWQVGNINVDLLDNTFNIDDTGNNIGGILRDVGPGQEIYAQRHSVALTQFLIKPEGWIDRRQV